ncbi:MAG TPA: peptide chain release factor 1 [Burkholderiaceae bacterium]|nr:peptide chain release factor 1 [Burkholderiaceae bacterium]
MNASMLAKLSRLEERLEEVSALLSAEDAARDMAEYRRLTREHAELAEVVEHFVAWRRARADRDTAEQLREDPEMRAFAAEEIASADARLADEAATLERLLLPKDPDDARDVLLEIRAGTGGEESALFAADLLRMYLRYAERRAWQVEVLSESPSELGGYREVIVRVAGRDVHARLKFESGGHRVQRVPETEAQGRIHTSACTVAVMPEADDASEVTLSPDDLRIDVFRASGAGGQHVNRTESAVRITHLPTGIVAECQDDRSQHRNRDRAMKVLATRIRDAQVRAAQQKEAATRKSLVGSGDRSERIRTYNFPQGRVTDHRINLTLHKLQAVMDGDLDDLIGPLVAEHQAERLAALAQEVA